ncbi:unknown [Sinorhizobium phage PBC5]|uniref:transcriptional regulator n=1 Tax=Sinorhizobium phage PBC5 TaxID=179237 RepID=UPI000009B927|nr:transcriptional regulator [Sinorhizobium phage PBC5]AAL49607.1 unknown [Sinorhizobium phage PBC5]
MLARTNPSPKKPNPIDTQVGARIRLRRNIIGMSQETLAAHLGITFQQVQKYEKGANRVGASRLQAISEALKVAPSYFFDKPEGATEANGGDEVMSFIASSEGIALNRAFARIQDSATRHKIVDLVKAVASSAVAA